MLPNMLPKFLPALSQKSGWLVLACLVAPIALLANARGWVASPRSEVNHSLAAAKTAAQTAPRKVPIDVEQLTYRSFGFETSEIRRPHGQFLLVIHNRSGARQLTLKLTSEDRSVVREVLIGPNKLDWHGVLNLPVGQYLLSTDRGQSCAIVIER